jgi:hypothetical protein
MINSRAVADTPKDSPENVENYPPIVSDSIFIQYTEIAVSAKAQK